jgi:hypothetical protein
VIEVYLGLNSKKRVDSVPVLSVRYSVKGINMNGLLQKLLKRFYKTSNGYLSFTELNSDPNPYLLMEI